MDFTPRYAVNDPQQVFGQVSPSAHVCRSVRHWSRSRPKPGWVGDRDIDLFNGGRLLLVESSISRAASVVHLQLTVRSIGVGDPARCAAHRARFGRPRPIQTGDRRQAAAAPMTEISHPRSVNCLATSRQISESAQPRWRTNAEQTASAARNGHGTVDLTHESSDASAVRSIRLSRTCWSSERVGRKSARSRHRVGAGRTDQHPRHQRDDRSRRCRRSGQAICQLWRTRFESSRTASAARPRRFAP